MNEYSGDNMELGPSQPSGQWHKYTYIKIGADILKNVYIHEKLNRVLRDQTRRAGACKLWMTNWFFRPLIIGITQDDGQTFRQNLHSPYFAIGSCVLLIVFCLFAYGIGSLVFTLTFSIVPFWILFNFIRKVKKVKADHVY